MGTLKNKIFAWLAVLSIGFGGYFLLAGGAGKLHQYVQAGERDNLDKSAFTTEEEYLQSVKKFDDEIERIDPAVNGFLTTGAVLTAGSIAAGIGYKKTKQDEEELAQTEV